MWGLLSYVLPVISVVVLVLYLLAEFVFHCRPSKLAADKDIKGAHVLITGGSEGLGKAIAAAFLKRGADVSIVARNEGKLQAAKKELEGVSGGGRVATFVGDVTVFKSIENAAKAATASMGRSPDILVSNAGTSIPGYLVDVEPDALEHEIRVNYLGSVFSARSIIPLMLERIQSGTATWRHPPRLLFVSSSAAFASFVGFTSYAGTKAAIGSFAVGLRNELLGDGIAVHVAFPSAINTPGFEEEEKRKPNPTREIEAGSGLIEPEVLAEHLIRNMQAGNFAITSDFQASLGRQLTNGLAPRHFLLRDILMAPFLALASPLSLYFEMDAVAKKHHASRSHLFQTKKKE